MIFLILSFLPDETLCAAESYSLFLTNNPLSEGIEYLKDPGEIFTPEILTDPEQRPEFIQNNSPVFDLGLHRGAVWLKFTLNNRTEQEDWIMEFDIHKFFTLELYRITGTSPHTPEFSYSYKEPFSSRDIQEPHLAFPIKISPGESDDFLIRISSENGMVLPLSIYDRESYLKHVSRKNTRWAVLYTVMIIMTIYNFFIYLYVKDLNYLYYILYVILYMFYLAALNGLGGQYVWPDISGRWTTVFSPLFGGLSLALGIILTREFLGLKYCDPPLRNYLRVLIALSLVLSLSNIIFTPFIYSYTLGNILGTIILLSILVISFGSVRRGNRSALIFLSSYMIIILGQIAYSLKAIGSFSSWPLLQNLNQYAPLIQVILLSHSLSYRISMLRKEKDQALAAALEAETTLAESLEQKVIERTEELQIANIRLHELSNLDGLTGLYNRRFFDKTLLKELKRHCRVSMPLTLILCDIDYFKRFNDSAGHLAGDECLRRIAGVLKSFSQREMDTAARYGGEEFALILPHNDKEEGFEIALKIQKAVSDLDLIHPDFEDSRRVSLSFGVVSVIPATETTSEDLIAAADRGLYESKARGRNQITRGTLKPLQ